VTDGDVAVVTGAGSGVGKVVATALLDAGYRVALAGRRAAALEETAGGRESALVVPTDVADAESVAALFAAVRERWGRVDLLMNNAGTFGPSGSVDEIAVEDWTATVATNLTGAFLCAREAFAAMRAQQPQGGRIINNGSISAHVPRPGPYGIACGQIDIGNAATAMTAGISVGARQADGSIRPEPTFDPKHVADAVLLMARLPLDANIPFLTITATTMPFLGRG
jgi:NADP-dependent 3-hydroxy acid dehydrogenase YdfG